MGLFRGSDLLFADLIYFGDRWRLFADLINDVALFLDMLAPSWPRLFLPLICLSSIFKVSPPSLRCRIDSPDPLAVSSTTS
jgi:hypothetical protein